MIAGIAVLVRPRNISIRRAPILAAEVGDPPLIWQLGYRWMAVLHATRRNLQIPTEAGRRTAINRWRDRALLWKATGRKEEMGKETSVPVIQTIAAALLLVVVQMYPVRREAETYVLLKSKWDVRLLLLRM